ncbi:MAG: HAD family hydrolase [candidate division Zixibacteria bacterium]|nr:HAD family hydrolase [candidate division Zixibacteria bacterium]
MIDTVTFDLWNTLIYTSPQDNLKYKNKRIEGFLSVLKQTGRNVSREEIEKAYDKSLEKYKPIRDRNEDISTREQVQIILECLGNSEFQDLAEDVLSELEKVLANAIFSDLPNLVERSEETLSYLDKKNYKIGLICNTGRTPGRVLREVLRRRNIIQFFRVLTFSDELKIRKPNPEIFLHTLKSLNTSPTTALHIGDELESDILGAKRCGMRAGWISPGRDKLQPDFQPEIKPDFILPDLVSLKNILGREKSA